MKNFDLKFTNNGCEILSCYLTTRERIRVIDTKLQLDPIRCWHYRISRAYVVCVLCNPTFGKQNSHVLSNDVRKNKSSIGRYCLPAWYIERYITWAHAKQDIRSWVPALTISWESCYRDFNCAIKQNGTICVPSFIVCSSLLFWSMFFLRFCRVQRNWVSRNYLYIYHWLMLGEWWVIPIINQMFIISVYSSVISPLPSSTLFIGLTFNWWIIILSELG